MKALQVTVPTVVSGSKDYQGMFLVVFNNIKDVSAGRETEILIMYW
jgi:hypothetical protein